MSQRVLEADAAEDAYNDDDDYEVDTPKRRHRGKGRVSGQLLSARRICVVSQFLKKTLKSLLHSGARSLQGPLCICLIPSVLSSLLFTAAQ